MNKNNFNSITVSLTELINRYLLQGVTKKQKEFLQICYKINTYNLESFCFGDFKERGYSGNNYRQYIHKLRPILYVVNKSNPVFYALKDIPLSAIKKITHRDMGEGSEMLQNILDGLKHYPIMIHDIKIKFQSDSLHTFLKSHGYSPFQSNSMIKLVHLFEELDSVVTICIYPKSAQVHVSNTLNPIIRDPAGILKLGMILGHIRQFLKGKSHELVNIPLCEDWTVYHYHLNKDGPSCSGRAFEITVGDFDSVLLRFYKKHLSNGKMIHRVEEIITIQKSIGEMLHDTLHDMD